ncbi:RNA chaperone Hfq [Reyranella soli]|uniref:RNA-binding protein Hfq n=1 Tax=Reyranella soli TaxID=1230389 RepID=A0A512NTD4_9HYPH|nr:RNA chaperone Hfq [Reyranella soli]GEP62227.1 RNA-binding protein Hfq [Reyranella soli]
MDSHNVQDVFLSHLHTKRTPVTVFLMNGIRLLGTIDSFDKFSLVLRRDRHSQIVYKHTISTIVPLTVVQLFERQGSPQQGRTLSLRS